MIQFTESDYQRYETGEHKGKRTLRYHEKLWIEERDLIEKFWIEDKDFTVVPDGSPVEPFNLNGEWKSDSVFHDERRYAIFYDGTWFRSASRSALTHKLAIAAVESELKLAVSLRSKGLKHRLRPNGDEFLLPFQL